MPHPLLPPSSAEPLLTPLTTSTSPPEPLTLGPGSSLRLQSLQQEDLTRRSDSPVANSSGQGSASVSSPVKIASSAVARDAGESALPRPIASGPVTVTAGGAGAGSTGIGATSNGDGSQQEPQDSMTLGQLKAITAGFPKNKQSMYTFPSPPPDTNDLMSELEEFYSYVEVSQVIEHKDSFCESWAHSTPFFDTPKDLQMKHIRHLLDGLSSTDPDVRFNNARHLLYIAQGTFQSSTSPEHHMHLILSCVGLLRSAGALQAIWEAVKGTGLRWEGVSSLPDPDAPQSPNGFTQQERQDYLDEINGELAVHLAVLYFMMEVYRGDEDWAEELMALEPPMPIYLFNLVAGLRERNAKGYPVKKLLLLLWKSILSCIGGMKDVERVKLFVRDVEGLPPDDKSKKADIRPNTKVAPQDYQTFRNEITSKYPSYMPPPIPNVDLDRISAATSPTPVRTTFSYHINPSQDQGHPPPGASGPSQQGPMPGTPAPSPPPSPAAKPKKQQYQTDQSRPFVLPFAPANFGRNGRPRAVPQSIDEAGELYQRNMRISTELWQTWKLREEYMADESGILKAEAAAASLAQKDAKAKDKAKTNGKDEGSKLGRRMESLSLEDEEAVEDEEDEMDPLSMLRGLEKQMRAEEAKETDEKKKKVLTQKRVDVQRLERIEILYRAILPNLQSAVIVLLKLLLATVTANNNNAQQDPPDSGNDEPVELNLEDTDIMRHREITSKAVSAILILALKWFKASHVMKFHYLSQLLVDSNCLLLILKMFGLQEVSTLVKTKNDRPDHNFFRFCNDTINPSQKGISRPEDAMLEARPPGARPASPKEGKDDEVELITDYSWRNFFSVINFVHVLQKLTKRKTHRVLLLVQYKSSAILKRILKVSHPTLQLYLLKVIKSQVPYCGRKWRQSNMKVITAIYLHCRPDLRDEWLTGIDVDADVEDSLPHEQALRTLVRFFNTKHYGAYAPLLHRRSSSQNHQPPEFGQLPPPSPGGRPVPDNDVFPPTRSMNSFDPESSFRAAFGHDTSEDVGDFAMDDLLYPQLDGDGELDFDPETSRAVWDRLGDIMGRYDDDISDSESVGSIGLLDFAAHSDGSVSEFDIDEIDEHEQQRAEWEHIDPETITALEEERDAASPRSPAGRPSRRRSSTGPVSPALRPVLIDRDDDSSDSVEVEDGPAAAEPHKGPAVDEVELVFGR